MMVLPIVIYILLVIAGFVNSKSQAITFLIFVFAFLLLGFNYQNPDYDNYLDRYDYSITFWANAVENTSTLEPGWVLLTFLGNDVLGLSFSEWHALLALLCYVSIYSFVRRFFYNQALVAASYLVTIFIVDVVQLRFFTAMCIIIWGFAVLFSERNRLIKTILYTLIIIIASTVHISSIFCLPFVLSLYGIKPKHIIAMLLIVTLAKVTIYSYFSAIFESGKTEKYEGLSSTAGAVFVSLVQIANALFLSLFPQKQTMIGSKFTQNVINQDYVKKINWFLLLLIPFYFDTAQYQRVFRYVVLLNFCYLSYQCNNKRWNYLLYVVFITIALVGSATPALLNDIFSYNFLIDNITR